LPATQILSRQHVLPQPPQSRLLVCVFTQEVRLLLVQACRPPEHDDPLEQLPFWHFCPEEQALPQLPQW
jgi:hypothetical protein